MTTKKHPAIDKKDCDGLVDFSIRLGQACWNVYCRSKAGFPRLFMLPNNDARCRANELFHLGFSTRLIICPSTAPDADGETMWQIYLDNMDGKVVLSGTAYPDTPKFILHYAKEFFLEGFRAGTVAVREIFKP
jgi:hypothetical protein